MVSNWKTSNIDCDIFTYGFFCTPCLFGENAYKVDQQKSCVAHTLSYGVIALSAQMLGAMMGNFLLPHDPAMMTLCASACNNVAIGKFAGNVRTKIRNKYSLSESIETDSFIHCMFTSCAICTSPFASVYCVLN